MCAIISKPITHFIKSSTINLLPLHSLLKDRQYEQAIQVIKSNRQYFSYTNFDFKQGTYTKNILLIDANYWLAVLCWDKGIQTAIHGHPDQAFMYVLEGEIIVENYQTPELVLKDTTAYQPDEYIFHHGKKNTLDNAVHRISTTKPSLSLHFYSDDPSKGRNFENST